MSRPETLQLLNFTVLILSMMFFDKIRSRRWTSLSIVTTIVVVTLLSCFSHPQGLVFLPASLFVLYFYITPPLGRTAAIAVLLIFFFVTLWSTLGFSSAGCPGYPEIELFWNQMTFHTEQLSNGILQFLKLKFETYSNNFLYKPNYTINYMPGYPDLLGVTKTLNTLILTVLVFNIGIAFAIVSASVVLVSLVYFKLCKYNFKNFDKILGVAILSSLGCFVLLFYDSTSNFYRSFFINAVLALSVSIALTCLYKKESGIASILAFVFFGFVVAFSTVLNLWFHDKFILGYEGPSVSMQRYNAVKHETSELLSICNAKLHDGRIVVDDSTYDSFARYPVILPITYLALQAQLSGKPFPDVLNAASPRAVFVSCGLMNHLNMIPDKTVGQTCCKVYDK